MKKFMTAALAGLLSVSLFAGCGNAQSTEDNLASRYEKLDTDLAVGMVTDSGTIDDRSFNQSTWEAISGSVENSKYLKPAGQTDAEYLESIANLYDAGYKFIAAPGYKFERAIAIAQDKYKDAKFVILDGNPVDENGNVTVGDNTSAVFFAEEQAGFLAAIAAAVEMKESEFGFIGGMATPSVQRFSYGFQQGVNYANKNLGTNISLKAENIVYQGSFTDKAGGQQVAAQMYDKGVKVIFTAAGGTGVGVITEAKSRAANGDTSVYVIGVDVDQYNDGVYNQDTNASVILTSALKKIDQAMIDMIKAEIAGSFPGGQTVTLTVENDGVGLPESNPNLSDTTVQKVNEVVEKIKAGEVTVAKTNDGSLVD